MDDGDENKQNSILETVAYFTLDVVGGTNQIVAERDLAGDTSMEDLPPVLPIDLCKCDVHTFFKSLNEQEARL